MRLVLSTIGKFHTFDLARELQARGVLAAIFTGYPQFKIRNEQLAQESIRTYPWVHAPYMALRYRRFLSRRFSGLWKHWEYLDRIMFDQFVSSHMPVCDVFVGLSGSALGSGKAAQRLGAKYVCDRGSSHIRVQDQLLRDEYARWDLEFGGIDRRIVDLEEAEYATSDCITTPSTFCQRSFASQGVSETKLKLIPYGVSLERFHPTATPDPTQFDILFVGAMTLRKGVQYLLQAYASIQHPRKSLTLAGGVNRHFIELMKRRSLWLDEVRVLGHVPQARLKDVMSRSHVMVLPSVEEGLAMVLAQSMACGCPVVATENTGAEDLFTNGKEGFIVQIRRADEIADRLQQIADDPALRSRLSTAALARVGHLGGWRDYGNRAFASYETLSRQ